MARAKPTNPTTKKPEPRETFLAELAKGQSVTAACKKARMDRSDTYKLRDADPAFQAAWNDALEAGTELLEDEARRRAMTTSDTLMIFLLKGRKPEVYRERSSIEHTGQVSTVIVTRDSDVDAKAAKVMGEEKTTL